MLELAFKVLAKFLASCSVLGLVSGVGKDKTYLGYTNP